MSEELKAKLRAIRFPIRLTPGHYTLQAGAYGSLNDEGIAQIDQAYKEAGYSQYKVHDNLKDQVEVEVVRPKLVVGKKMPNIMSGQEFYDRFEKLLQGRLVKFDTKTEEKHIRGLFSDVMEAARKAAGLEKGND